MGSTPGSNSSVEHLSKTNQQTRQLTPNPNVLQNPNGLTLKASPQAHPRADGDLTVSEQRMAQVRAGQGEEEGDRSIGYPQHMLWCMT